MIPIKLTLIDPVTDNMSCDVYLVTINTITIHKDKKEKLRRVPCGLYYYLYDPCIGNGETVEQIHQHHDDEEDKG